MLSLLCLKQELDYSCYVNKTVNVGNFKHALQYKQRAPDIDVTNIFSKSVNTTCMTFRFVIMMGRFEITIDF